MHDLNSIYDLKHLLSTCSMSGSPQTPCRSTRGETGVEYRNPAQGLREEVAELDFKPRAPSTFHVGGSGFLHPNSKGSVPEALQALPVSWG